MRFRKYNNAKNLCKELLNLYSKSPRAARQLKFLQICYHTSNGPMNHTIPQVGGHIAATADLSSKLAKMKAFERISISVNFHENAIFENFQKF